MPFMTGKLTIRGIPEEVRQRLESLSRAQGQSINAVVLEILRAAVEADERRRILARYVTWNPEDLAEFNLALAIQRQIEPVLRPAGETG